jgi:glycosyltransferase involved in cell wall biosynthesis
MQQSATKQALTEPLVTVLTPVYNGEKYLAECVDSVLAQTYRNWEYVIVNNFSKDGTRQLAENYAKADRRIRVVNNDQLYSVYRNHNIAIANIGPNSTYCKLVHADDWLFPECLEKMVALAEANPSVGVVSSYGLAGDRVFCDGLRYPSTVVSGKELCALTLRSRFGTCVFGGPTSTMFRCSVVRQIQPLYNEENFHADIEACFALLQKSDLGFVHAVLTYTRLHETSLSTSVAAPMCTDNLKDLVMLRRFGPLVLEKQELETLQEQYLKHYYRILAENAVRGREKRFWDYHRTVLQSVGLTINKPRLAAMAFRQGLLLARTRAKGWLAPLLGARTH